MVPQKNKYRNLFTTGFLSLLLVFGSVINFTADIQAKPQTSKTTKAKNKAPHFNKKTVAKLQKNLKKLAPKIDDDEKEPQASEAGEDPDARQKWFTFERTYPFDSIPADARREAFDSIAQNSFEAAAALPTWRSIGPTPSYSAFPNNWGFTSGRINSVAVSPANPNIILVGASTGGVWRSTDGGQSFNPTTDDQVDLAVGYIAFAPSDPNIVYAGMGDAQGGYNGNGVLKSTNAGKTWQRVSNSSLPAPGRIFRLEVDPNNPNRVYVAQYAFANTTTNQLFSSGFLLSEDGGVTWKNTLRGLPRDLAISPANPQIIYVTMVRVDPAGSGSPGLYRSQDGGLTWASVYTSPYPLGIADIRVAVTPAASNRVYVYSGGGNASGLLELRLATSNDNGTTWSSRILDGLIDSGQIGYNTYIYADPANASTLYIGTRDVFKSTDAGATWKNLNNNFTLSNAYQPTKSNAHPDQHALTFLPGNSNVVFIGNDGGLYKSSNGGTTFTSLNLTLSLSQIVGMDISPFDPTATLIGTQDNGTQLRFDDGTWGEIVSGDGGDALFSRSNPNLIFTSYIYGTVFRIDFEKGTGAQITNQQIFGELTSQRINFYPPIVGTKNGRLYVGSWRLFISRNNGSTWYTPGWTSDLTKGSSDTINAIGVSDLISDVIYTGSSQGRVSVTKDSGENWADITAGLPNRTIKSITTDPKNPAIAYLTVSGFASGHVFKTTNYGTSWADISGNLPNIPTSAFIFDPVNAGTIYVGTDIGAFRSTDDGKSWEPVNKGIPPVVITKLVSHPSGIIQAATYGRGVYELNVNAVNVDAVQNNHTTIDNKENQQ